MIGFISTAEVADMLGVTAQAITNNINRADDMNVLYTNKGYQFTRPQFKKMKEIIEINKTMRTGWNNTRKITKTSINRDRGLYHRLTPFGGILNREFDKPGEIA
jgi:predicted DNA-binding protein YlxM (UPF0122 family)